MEQPCKTYEQANWANPLRENWNELPIMPCKCGSRFYAEVEGQTSCRDCHATAQTGFYAPGVKSISSFHPNRW